MLYTRSGDDGKTRLYDTKRRVSKLSCDIEALGALDELGASVGVCYAFAKNDRRKYKISNRRNYEIIRKYEKKEKESVEECHITQTRNLAGILLELLHHLFVIQAEIAGADKTLKKEHIAFLEEVTDTVEKIIPPIRSFTLPGATVLSAHLDRARTLARRAERRVRGLSKKRMPSADTLHYLNRLSSVLFALARFAAFKAGVKEEKPHY